MQVVSASSPGCVLVTGGEGFTAGYLIPELQRQGYKVAVHSEKECDLRDAAAVRAFVQATAPDFVIHLAAISFVAHRTPAQLYDVNTVGTTNLLDALVSARPNVQKVILASSSQVYGNIDADNIDEAYACKPLSHYGCSKLAMEHMAATYRDRLPILITRPFNYTGPGQNEQFLVPKIIAHHARGAESIDLGNIDVVRDFADVRMVVDAYCRLLQAECDSVVLNICSGRGLSPRWLLDEASRLSGRKLNVNVRPDLLRSADAARMVGSNEKLVQVIGHLKHLDFSEALRAMLSAAGAQGRDAR